MKEKCKLIIHDEVNCEFVGLSPVVRRACSNKLKFFIQAARHTPAFKLGRWDGYTRFFSLSGSTYTNLLNHVLPIIVENNYEIEILDNRKKLTFDFPIVEDDFLVDYAPNSIWPEGHPCAGEEIRLRPHQVQCLNDFRDNPRSMGEICTSAGKTIISACMSILGEPYGRTLIVVPSRDLVKQTRKDYELLGLNVGEFHGSKKELDKKHTICTWQSLESWNKTGLTKDGDNINDFADSLSTIIIDEAHTAKSNVLQKLLGGTFKNVPIRWGISGTIPKDESVLYSLNAVLGPIVTNVRARDLMDKGILSDCNINMLQMKDNGEYETYQDELKYLVTDSDRLDWIAEVIKDISKTGNTVALYTRIETGEELHSRIPDSYLVHGAIKSQDREDAYEIINDDDNKIVLASSGVASTGLNLPRIFNLVLIEPGKSFVRVIQSIGRGIRKAKDKNHVEIYDISSTLKFSKRHYNSRKKLYDDAGYPHNTVKIDYSSQLLSNDIKYKN